VPLRRHSRIGAAALRAAKRLDVKSLIRSSGFATLRS
jgi:hypothetical protein